LLYYYNNIPCIDVAAVCSPDALSSQHHVSVGWGGKYIKLTGTDETTSNYLLANIDQNDCDRCMYLLKYS